MSILRIKDKETGEFKTIPAIQGPKYELTDEDVYTIHDEVVNTIKPTLKETNERINSLEEVHTDIYNQVSILEAAIANFSKFEVVKVESLEEMQNPNIIYLLPVDTHYEEYIVFNEIPEKIGDTDIDLTQYVSKNELRNNTKFYRHNITLKYSHYNSHFNSSGTDGRFVANFVLENTDMNPYSFTHNFDFESSKAVVMDQEPAWNFLRLYYALQFSTSTKDTLYNRPCAGSMITVGSSSSNYASQYGVIENIGVYYDDPSNADWTRYIKVTGMDCNTGNYSDKVITIPCGHPKFDSAGKEIKWEDQTSFYNGEFQAVTSSGSGRYKSYFCQGRLKCEDYVEEIHLVL